VTFAAHQFELAAPQDDGSPLLAHLESAWRASGKMPAMLADAPTLPEGCAQLWADFATLHDSRGSTGFGPMRITWRDLADWQDVTGARLDAWQVDAIRRADNAYLADYAERQPKGTK
jgi:hypothetical protein